MRWEAGDTSSTHRGGAKMSTKLASLTQRARENPKCKYTSLTHLLTEDFLKECYWELKRGKAPGIDGVGVEDISPVSCHRIEDVLLKSRMRASRTFGSVRGVKTLSKTRERVCNTNGGR